MEGAEACIFVFVGAEWRVRRGTAPASGTEQASSNRGTPFSFPFAPEPALLFFRDAVGAGVGVSPAMSRAVHCGAPEERARVGRRNARVSTARALRATDAPLVACARRRERVCSVISTLCRTGAVAEIACSVRCGGSSSPSSSSSCLDFLFVGGVWAEDGEGERLRFVCAGEPRACRVFWRDAWIWGQVSRRSASSSGREEPPHARRSAASMKFGRTCTLLDVLANFNSGG